MLSRAIILARGLGTRMRSADPGAALTADQQRAADAGVKAMMPIAGRPFLDYVLSAAADAGLTRIAIVSAPDHRDLRHYYQVVAPPTRVAVDFVVQREPRGTADAVLAAEHWADGDAFLVLNGDNLYPAAALAAVHRLDQPGLPGFEAADLVRTGNIPADRVRAFALIEQDDQGWLTRIIEKPSREEVERLGPAVRVSMNCWRFDSRIFQACRAVTPSARGELELPAAVGLAVERGVRFQVVPAAGPVLDLSQRGDAADVARRLSGAVPRP
jgi:glucose-1-phosphate thymidylyltransferase